MSCSLEIIEAVDWGNFPHTQRLRPRAKGLLILKVRVSNICQVRRFLACVSAAYLCFPFLHRFHPLNLSLCSYIPLARSPDILGAQHSTVFNKRVRCATMYFIPKHTLPNPITNFEETETFLLVRRLPSSGACHRVYCENSNCHNHLPLRRQPTLPCRLCHGC